MGGCTPGDRDSFGGLGHNEDAARHVFEVERVGPVELGGARVTAAAAGSSHSAVVTGVGTLLASAGLLQWSERGGCTLILTILQAKEKHSAGFVRL